MPTYEKTAGARHAMRTFLDEQGLWDLVSGARVMGAEIGIIEEVSGLPGQSAAGAFVFGDGYGCAKMAARACGLRLEKVKSSVWKLRLRAPADKSAARARASELMPAEAWRWPLKKHDGRAEAAMIGLYAEKYL